MPDPVSPGEVNGQRGYWLRARLAGGGYGAPASYTQNADHTYAYQPATFALEQVPRHTLDATQEKVVAVLEAARALDYSDAAYILAQGDIKEGFMLQAMIEDRLAGQALIAFYRALDLISLSLKSIRNIA